MHEIKHASRADFFATDSWSKSKKGNLYIQDHGHTYTLVGREGSLISFQCVITRFDTDTKKLLRKEIGPFFEQSELEEAVWPADAESPVGV